MVWLAVEYELPEDGEIVEVLVGRYHVMEMRYDGGDVWIPCGGKLTGKQRYPHPVLKWRRRLLNLDRGVK